MDMMHQTINDAAGEESADAVMQSGQMRQKCHVCHGPATIRTSFRVTELVVDYYIQCRNIMCGGTWKAQMAVCYMISPSALENSNIDVPDAPPGTIFPKMLKKKTGEDDEQTSIFDMM
jgi:hypothetical protein